MWPLPSPLDALLKPLPALPEELLPIFTDAEFITLLLMVFCAPLLLPAPPEPLPPLPAPSGEGDSSFDLRFSARGGRNATGDVEGVLLAPPSDPPLLAVPRTFALAVSVGSLDAPVALAAFVSIMPPRPPRPLEPPFLNLLCICRYASQKYRID